LKRFSALYEGSQFECITLLTSKKDLSSVFFGGPGAGAAGVTDITSARSENRIISYVITMGFRVSEALPFDNVLFPLLTSPMPVNLL
jgi:hypothetical protein